MKTRKTQDHWGQLHDAVNAAHGLTGAIAGLAGGWEWLEKNGWPDPFDSEEEAARKINNELAFKLWGMWRRVILLQHFNPVWATLGDLVDYADRASRARGRAITPALRRLRFAVAEHNRAREEATRSYGR